MNDASDRLPPFDLEAERGVLGCILQKPELLDAIDGNEFYDLRHREIAKAIFSLHFDRSEVSAVALYQRLKDTGKVEQVGGFEAVQELLDAAPSPEAFTVFLATVQDRATRRRMLQDASEVTRQAFDLSKPVESPEAQTSIEKLKARRFDFSSKPQEFEPRFYVNGVPISTVGNITAISSEPKTGKSAFIGAMIAATATRGTDADCLGVTSSNPQGFAVVHVDTEQSPADHWNLINRSLNRAGLTEPPSWWVSYCLTGFTVTESTAAIKCVLKDAKAQFGGVHSVLIDGAADLVNDVNDAEESNGYVASHHALAIKYACPFIEVIHLNPGTGKTRGHLGSQLERKGETNLRIESDGSAVVVYSTKNRRAPIPQSNGPRFMWSNERGMHVSVESAGDVKRAELVEEHLPIVQELFSDTKAYSHSGLLKGVMTLIDKSEETAKRRIRKWGQIGLIRKTAQGAYVQTT